MKPLSAQVHEADAPTPTPTDANQLSDAPEHHEQTLTASERNVAQEARERAELRRVNALPLGHVPLKGRRFRPGETPSHWQMATRSVSVVDEVPLADDDREDDAAGRAFDQALGRAAIARIASEMERRGSPPRLIAAVLAIADAPAGTPRESVAVELGVSPATFYRDLAELAAELEPLREMLDRP